MEPLTTKNAKAEIGLRNALMDRHVNALEILWYGWYSRRNVRMRW